jgi:hypothetical protein
MAAIITPIAASKISKTTRFPGPLSGATYEQVNTQQEGLLGVRIKPLKAMTINLESEIGRANHPFTPVSDRNYQALGARFGIASRS